MNQKKIFTIPNILSFVRFLLVPLFAYLFCSVKDYVASGIVVAVSGATDILDGFIARRFHMESDLGKVLDPLADKLTQAVMCLVLIYRYPIMFWLLIFFAVKEFLMVVMGYAYMKRTGIINSARWYGKASSIVQYIVMLGLILNPTISEYSALVAISLCITTHVLSLLMYAVFYVRSMRHPHREAGVAMRPVDWQIMVMYLLLLLCFFMLMFTSGDAYLKEVLPPFLFTFLRFASIVGVVGIPAFFLGEKMPRDKLDPTKFPFKAYAWEHEGKTYERFGIKWWKNRTPDMSKYIKRAFSKQGNLMRDPNHLKRLVQETCSAELLHWILFALSPIFAVLMNDLGILATVLYAISNLSSIIIQRYNRPRIMQIIQRIEKRNA